MGWAAWRRSALHVDGLDDERGSVVRQLDLGDRAVLEPELDVGDESGSKRHCGLRRARARNVSERAQHILAAEAHDDDTVIVLHPRRSDRAAEQHAEIERSVRWRADP